MDYFESYKYEKSILVLSNIVVHFSIYKTSLLRIRFL
jgi:hypothetical protein